MRGTVAPFAGAWIETAPAGLIRPAAGVAPFAGAWIETAAGIYRVSASPESRPLRARGLKLRRPPPRWMYPPVAPFAGAWIETLPDKSGDLDIVVAPFAGAWIETR